MRPPRLAEWIARHLVPRRLGNDVLGDLDAEFVENRVSRQGRLRATLWYWGQVLAFPFAYRFRRGRSPSRTRGASFDFLIQDVRHAAAGLRASPGFTVVALTTLALGIGANTAVFSVMDDVLLRPLPYRHPDELVAVGSDFAGVDEQDMGVSSAEYRDLRDGSSTLSGLAASWPADANVVPAGTTEPRRIHLVLSSHNLFSVLGVSPALGRDFTPDDAGSDIGYVGILSNEAWLSLFHGDPHVLGRTLRVDDDSVTVVGVMPEGFQHPGAAPTDPVSVWMPISLAAGNRFDFRTYRPLTLIGRRRPGTSLEAVRADLAAVSRAVAEKNPQAYPSVSGWAVRARSLHDRVVGDVRPMLLILMGAVVFVLLTACTNVAALLFARGQKRSTEMAIRIAVGGGRSRILGQLFLESLLLSLLGTAAGLVGAHGALLGLRQVAVEALPRSATATLSFPVLAFTAGVSMFTTFAFGLLPAAYASRGHPQQLLFKRSAGARGGARGRAFLATLQVAVSVTLLVGAGVLVKSFAGMARAQPGFDADSVLALHTWLPVPNDPSKARFGTLPARFQFVDRSLRALESVPGVERAAIISVLPSAGVYSQPFAVDDLTRPQAASETLPTVEFREASDGYFDVMQIPVLQGRGLEAGDDESHRAVVVVDRSFADRWLGPNPIGRHLRFGDSKKLWVIVGVVGNVRDRAVDVPYRPHVYLSYRQSLGWSFAFVFKHQGSDDSTGNAVRAALHDVAPDQPFYGLSTMNALLGRGLTRERLLGELVGLFAVLALLLSALGVYGVTSYLVRQRSHELGVRMALGASGWEVIRLGLKQIARIGFVGTGLGLIAAVAGTWLLRSTLHGVSPLDPAAYVRAAAVMAVVVVAAGTLAASRAAAVGPLDAMKTE